jgi:DNA-3-methyladenine glycosylase
MLFEPLPRSFYEPSAKVVARSLLGHLLLRQTTEGLCGGPIVETEAYLEGDPACHATSGLSARNRVMFGPPGHAYVYFIYGAHFCVNAVCQPAGRAEAVLIRAVEPSLGQDLLRTRRPALRPQQLTNGPAKLCEAMAIDRALDGTDLCDPASPLFIAHNPNLDSFRHERGPVSISTRVGISKAAELPLRFFFTRSESVSRGKPACSARGVSKR